MERRTAVPADVRRSSAEIDEFDRRRIMQVMRETRILAVALAFLVGCHTPIENSLPDAGGETEVFSFESWLDRLKVESEAEITAARHDRETIDLGGTDISDDELRYLRGLTRLRTLNVSSTGLSNAAIDTILDLRSLKELDIVFTRITGRGIAQLSAHPNLESLHVWHDQLDDDGIAGLEGMSSLKQIYLWVPDFGDQGEKLPPKIKEVMPNVRVDVMWYVDPMDGH